MIQKLTTKFIETRKPNPAKREAFRDTVVPGLVLRVNKSGTKTFSFHKRINGKMKRLTIGQFGPFSLDDARERARQILYEVEMECPH
ncbi:Arm DNA-binding domain-containing protein [Tritonibacter sp. SIMBA_163]|uniref:Arm DNA-binding domain-containing protein n=1 Tax=Tritonibacter sp. SIMBA_163 TaxID=3080868 RepID=UPI003980AE7E